MGSMGRFAMSGAVVQVHPGDGRRNRSGCSHSFQYTRGLLEGGVCQGFRGSMDFRGLSAAIYGVFWGDLVV